MRARLFFVVASSFASACVPAGTPDAGTTLSCAGDGPQSVATGAHGAAWQPLQDGDEVPCFDRPQGGVGTHLTTRFTGFDQDAHGFEVLRFDMIAKDDGRTISGYRTRAFPLDCQEDGALLIVDVPVRFDVTVGEAGVIDDVEVTLTTTLELQSGEELSSTVDLRLFESEFIPPAWWEEE